MESSNVTNLGRRRVHRHATFAAVHCADRPTPSQPLRRWEVALTRIRRLLLPGFVFQSVVIAGGYGTGREIVEFFLRHGPVPGLLGMLAVSMVIWSLVAAVSFEFARRFRAFEYRAFFRRLLGRGWVTFEVLYGLQLVLVLAVVAAAAGAISRETFGVPYAAGVAGVIGAVGILLMIGSAGIERFLAAWSLLLYAVYAVLFVWALSRFGGVIGQTLQASSPGPPTVWLRGGVEYAAYNLATMPAVFFALRHIETRRAAVGAGLLTGIIAMIPALLFYLAMVGLYPEIVGRDVPANAVLEALGNRGFQVIFQIVLFGTLIETGTGMIHAVNERLAAARAEAGRTFPAWMRGATSVVFLLLALALSPIGLVDLIARGYGTLTWGFLLVYVIPILTIGVWRLRRADVEGAARAP